MAIYWTKVSLDTFVSGGSKRRVKAGRAHSNCRLSAFRRGEKRFFVYAGWAKDSVNSATSPI